MYVRLSIQIGSFWREPPRAWKDHPEAKIPNCVEHVRPGYVLPLTLDYLDVHWDYEPDNARRSEHKSGWYLYFTGFHADGSHAGLTARGSAYREDAERILTTAGLISVCLAACDKALTELIDNLNKIRE